MRALMTNMPAGAAPARRRDPGGGFVDLEQHAIQLVLEVGPDHTELRHPGDGAGTSSGDAP